MVTSNVFRQHWAALRALLVLTAILGRQQIARPRIMPARREGTPHDAGELAGDEYAKGFAITHERSREFGKNRRAEPH